MTVMTRIGKVIRDTQTCRELKDATQQHQQQRNCKYFCIHFSSRSEYKSQIRFWSIYIFHSFFFTSVWLNHVITQAASSYLLLQYSSLPFHYTYACKISFRPNYIFPPYHHQTNFRYQYKINIFSNDALLSSSVAVTFGTQHKYL